MTSVKNDTFGLVLAVSFLVAANVRADVSISDANVYKDNVNLYQIFNDYFAEQLGVGGSYASSNDLYADRGVDSFTTWTTNNSQMVGAFKVAALGHTMSVSDSEGNILNSFTHYGGTAGLGGGKDKITDLSGQSAINLPDGVSINFQLDAYWGSNIVYTWSSNPEDNSDEMVHMVALDITNLYNAKYGTNNDSVFMLAWEDLHLYSANGGDPADWDYQDFVVILTNVRPDNNVTISPEPATLAILALGLAGLGVARRRMKK